MRTVVFQSFRTSDVPGWLSRAMESVRQWAEQRGFAYRFLGDEFFDCLPGWFRERIGGDVLPMSDLARLEWALRLLEGEADRVVWVDADVLVFDPDRLVVDEAEDAILCSEIWVHLAKDGKLVGRPRVNNCVCAFRRGSSFLAFYRDACLKRARTARPSDRWVLGPSLLSDLHRVVPLAQLANVGMVSPLMLRDLQTEGSNRLRGAYMSFFTVPFAAANLCGSRRDTPFGGFMLDDRAYALAVERLLATRGDVLNRHIRMPAGEGVTPA
ncbi:MAG: hypothetical protein H6923_03035 [Alphaproteobacteria bacterium]|nr:hypothetical protein [Alphaproteobacteria bacterium]